MSVKSIPQKTWVFGWQIWKTTAFNIKDLPNGVQTIFPPFPPPPPALPMSPNTAMENAMSEMIERIAGVIEAAIERHGVPLEMMEGTLEDARAVLAAMRPEKVDTVEKRVVTEWIDAALSYTPSGMETNQPVNREGDCDGDTP